MIIITKKKKKKLEKNLLSKGFARSAVFGFPASLPRSREIKPHWLRRGEPGILEACIGLAVLTSLVLLNGQDSY